jgi:hypothetical protein
MVLAQPKYPADNKTSERGEDSKNQEWRIECGESEKHHACYRQPACEPRTRHVQQSRCVRGHMLLRMAAHPLAGAQAKIERARQHLVTLQQEIRTFTNANPYGFVTELEEETGHYIVRAREYVERPAHAGLIVGDLVHNLRSALDHVAYALADLGKGATRNTAWPLVSDEKDWPSQEGLLLKGMLKGHRAAIKELQPYQARNAIYAGKLPRAEIERRWTVHMHTLVIGRLDNLDKHVGLLPVVPLSKSEPPTFHGVKRAEGTYPSGDVHMENGAELFRITKIELAGSPAEVQVQTPPTYNIVFGDPFHTRDEFWKGRTKASASVRDLANAFGSFDNIVRRFWEAF